MSRFIRKEHKDDSGEFELVFGAYPLPSVTDPDKSESNFVFRWSWIRRRRSVIAARRMLFQKTPGEESAVGLGLDMYFPTPADLAKKYTLSVAAGSHVTAYEVEARPNWRLVPALDMDFFAFLAPPEVPQPKRPEALKDLAKFLEIVKIAADAQKNGQAGWYLHVSAKFDDAALGVVVDIDKLDAIFKPAFSEVLAYARGAAMPVMAGRVSPVYKIRPSIANAGPTVAQMCQEIGKGERSFMAAVRSCTQTAGFEVASWDRNTLKSLSVAYVAICLWGPRIRNSVALQRALAPALMTHAAGAGDARQLAAALALVANEQIDLTEPRRRLALALATGTALPFWDGSNITWKSVPEVFGWQSQTIYLPTSMGHVKVTLEYDGQRYELLDPNLKSAFGGKPYLKSATEWYEDSLADPGTNLPNSRKAKLSASRVERGYWRILQPPLDSYDPKGKEASSFSLFWEERWTNLGSDRDIPSATLADWNQRLNAPFRDSVKESERLPPRFVRHPLYVGGPVRVFLVTVGDLSVGRGESIEYMNFPDWCVKAREVLLEAAVKIPGIKNALLLHGRPGNHVEQTSTVGNGRFAVSVSGVAGKTPDGQFTRFTRAAIVPRGSAPQEFELVPARGFIPRSDGLMTAGTAFDRVASSLALDLAQGGTVAAVESIDRFVELTVAAGDTKNSCYGFGFDIAANSGESLSDLDFVDPPPESLAASSGINPVVRVARAKDDFELWMKCSDFLGQWRYWRQVGKDDDPTWRTRTDNKVRIQWSSSPSPIPVKTIDFVEDAKPTALAVRRCKIEFDLTTLETYLKENFELGTKFVPELDVLVFRRAPKLDLSLSSTLLSAAQGSIADIAEEYEHEKWYANMAQDRWQLMAAMRQRPLKEITIEWACAAIGGWEYKVALVARRDESQCLIPRDDKTILPAYQVTSEGSDGPNGQSRKPPKGGWVTDAALTARPMGRCAQPFISNVFCWSTQTQVDDPKRQNVAVNLLAVAPLRAQMVNPERVLLRIPDYVTIDVQKHERRFEKYVRMPYITGMLGRLRNLSLATPITDEGMDSAKKFLRDQVSSLFVAVSEILKPELPSEDPEKRRSAVRSAVTTVIEPRGVVRFSYNAPTTVDSHGLPIAATRIVQVEERSEALRVAIERTVTGKVVLRVPTAETKALRQMKGSFAILTGHGADCHYLGRATPSGKSLSFDNANAPDAELEVRNNATVGFAVQAIMAHCLVDDCLDNKCAVIEILELDSQTTGAVPPRVGEPCFIRVLTKANNVSRYLAVVVAHSSTSVRLRVYDPKARLPRSSSFEIFVDFGLSKAQTNVVATCLHVPDSISWTPNSFDAFYFVRRGPAEDLSFLIQHAGPGRVDETVPGKQAVAPFWSPGFLVTLRVPASQLPVPPEITEVIAHPWAIEYRFSDLYQRPERKLDQSANVELRIMQAGRGRSPTMQLLAMTETETLEKVVEMIGWNELLSENDDAFMTGLASWLAPKRVAGAALDNEIRPPAFLASLIWDSKHRDKHPRLILVDSAVPKEARDAYAHDPDYCTHILSVPGLRERSAFSLSAKVIDNVAYGSDFELTSNWSAFSQPISPMPPWVSPLTLGTPIAAARNDELSFLNIAVTMILPDRKPDEFSSADRSGIGFDLVLRPEFHARMPVTTGRTISYIRSSEFASRLPVVKGPSVEPWQNGSKIEILFREQVPSKELMQIFVGKNDSRLSFQMLLRESLVDMTAFREIWQHDLPTLDIIAPEAGTETSITVQFRETFEQKSESWVNYQGESLQGRAHMRKANQAALLDFLTISNESLQFLERANDTMMVELPVSCLRDKGHVKKIGQKEPIVLFDQCGFQIVVLEESPEQATHVRVIALC